MVNAKTFLVKRYNEDIELEDAIHTAILTLKVREDGLALICIHASPGRVIMTKGVRSLSAVQEGFEGQMTEHNIELAVVGADRKLKVLSPPEIRDYLGEVE